MKILSVVGARPQFVKLAPIALAASEAGVTHVIAHTGQHYDANMSQHFFDDLGIGEPDFNLGVGSTSHGAQTGRMLMDLEPVMQVTQPDWVLVYGDTNSTLAAAVCAAKLHLPLAHLEAGLRSFNRRMPEEHNRVLTDHSADLCLAPTETAMEHLTREGLGERSVLVGDVMTDVLLNTAARVAERPVTSPIASGQEYALATIHRPDNTDSASRLKSILTALAVFPMPVYLPAHPRLVAKASAHGLSLERGSIIVTSPLSYPQLVQAVIGARTVVTDSGGLQKEAFLLGIPTTTVRPETEWVETLKGDWNRLSPQPADLVPAATRPTPTAPRGTPYGDGQAARRVLATLTAASSSSAGALRA